ncbi:hypothetical protein PHLGIDRAFT_459513 [Phlebiopsis gigantea 11061_1 CR5-6]|uniref:Uncharacterized protein n=1 Tax=Phlebiopsis gigantea (strain 11061_1 CR5-6) TaxID=745531 RepID=A0A0C3PJS1_PHLG1|nr:hypothetical protein PHLGIDRAFT_459513 [Phlebiopsis gigantea 11061_1 CR5-6]
MHDLLDQNKRAAMPGGSAGGDVLEGVQLQHPMTTTSTLSQAYYVRPASPRNTKMVGRQHAETATGHMATRMLGAVTGPVSLRRGIAMSSAQEAAGSRKDLC